MQLKSYHALAAVAAQLQQHDCPECGVPEGTPWIEHKPGCHYHSLPINNPNNFDRPRVDPTVYRFAHVED